MPCAKLLMAWAANRRSMAERFRMAAAKVSCKVAENLLAICLFLTCVNFPSVLCIVNLPDSTDHPCTTRHRKSFFRSG